jgi:formyl-CoA transferase
LSETPGETLWVGPELGQHTDEVLASIGISSDAISALRETGIV